MPRPTGAFGATPITVTGWPTEIAAQIARDDLFAEMSSEPYVPIRLSALSADRRTVKVPFGDDALTLVYKPSGVNAIQEAREIEDRAAGRVVMSQARSLAEMILSWDLLDDEGKPLTVSVDVLAGLGLDVSNKIYNAVLDDLLPNRRRAPDSPNGSPAAESSDAAQSGTPTS